MPRDVPPSSRPTLSAGRGLVRAVGARLRRAPALVALAQLVRDPCADAAAFDPAYEAGPDHWRYVGNPAEAARHDLALEMLRDAAAGRPFRSALEIACAEGVFTAQLAALCTTLTAVDFSEVALARARARCAHLPRVTFRSWDLRRDEVPGRFDVVTVMDVLTYIRRPPELRRVLDKLVAALRPGDLLLAGDFRNEHGLEESWLGQHLLFGAKWILKELAARPEVEALRWEATDTHMFVLVRKC